MPLNDQQGSGETPLLFTLLNKVCSGFGWEKRFVNQCVKAFLKRDFGDKAPRIEAT